MSMIGEEVTHYRDSLKRAYLKKRSYLKAEQGRETFRGWE